MYWLADLFEKKIFPSVCCFGLNYKETNNLAPESEVEVCHDCGKLGRVVR